MVGHNQKEIEKTAWTATKRGKGEKVNPLM
jgi:hypothetical protein